MSTVTHNIPVDLLPVPEDQFETVEFNPQQRLKHKKSFVNKVFSKRHRTRNDDASDDKSESDSIRTMSSTGSGSIRSFMFSRKQRSNTMTSTTSTSSFGSVYSNASMRSNASTESKCDKYGLPKDSWVPQYF